MESKYPTIVNKHKDVFRQIDKAIEFRNKLAYCMLVTADEFFRKLYGSHSLQYCDGKGQMEMIEITDTDIREKLRKCSELLTKLKEIRSEITQFNIT